MAEPGVRRGEQPERVSLKLRGWAITQVW